LRAKNPSSCPLPLTDSSSRAPDPPDTRLLFLRPFYRSAVVSRNPSWLSAPLVVLGTAGVDISLFGRTTSRAVSRVVFSTPTPHTTSTPNTAIRASLIVTCYSVYFSLRLSLLCRLIRAFSSRSLLNRVEALSSLALSFKATGLLNACTSDRPTLMNLSVLILVPPLP